MLGLGAQPWPSHLPSDRVGLFMRKSAHFRIRETPGSLSMSMSMPPKENRRNPPAL